MRTLRRPRFTLGFLFLGMLAGGIWCEEPAALNIIDCHVHLWDIGRPEGLGWIKKDDPILYKSILPGEHEALARTNKVTGVVVVQAGQNLPDNKWCLDITEPNKQLYRGVVGNLSKIIGTPEFQPYFEALCKNKRYVGYRLSGRYQIELTEAFFQDLKRTADMGKSVDILIGDFTLDDALAIADRVPNIRIILDHIGGVKLTDSALDPKWVEQMRAVALKKNVYCKVSGLYGRAQQQPAPQDLAYYLAALDHVFDCFGEDRLVFGSDWPVSNATGDYASVIKLTKSYLERKSPTVLEKVFRTNAEAFYRIPKVEPSATEK